MSLPSPLAPGQLLPPRGRSWMHGGRGTTLWTVGIVFVIAMMAVIGARHPGSTVASYETKLSYSCCTKADIDTVRHPGDTLKLHWIVTGTPTAKSATIILRAVLKGPYLTVAGLKADNHAPAAQKQDLQSALTITAPPVHPTGTPGKAPESTLYIPRTAGSGYYNLSLTVDEGSGSSYGASSIIQVR